MIPGGRPIVVDGKNYHWSCGKARRPSRYITDDYGDDIPVYDNVVNIIADDGGPVVQVSVTFGPVTPKWVEQSIRLLGSRLGKRPKRKR
jgi:hypothetical protein